MISPTPMICSECNEVGTFKCESCDQTYCQQHAILRQRLLDEQLDWLTVDHDDLVQDLSSQIARPKYHPSMSAIDKWEEETIARIQSTAVLARRALIDALDQHVIKVRKSLSALTEKLHEARQRINSFNENDIQDWTTTLQELKQMPVFPVTIDQYNNIHGLIINVKEQPQRAANSELNNDKSTLSSLLSIIHDPIDSTSMSKKTQRQTITKNVTKNSNISIKKVQFEDAPSNSSETNTPGKVVIIEEQQSENPTTSPIRQVPIKIPLGS